MSHTDSRNRINRSPLPRPWFMPVAYLLILLIWLLPHNPRTWLLHEQSSWYTWFTCHWIPGAWPNLLLSLALLILAGLPVEIRHPRITPFLFLAFAILQALGHTLLGSFIYYGSPLGIALAFCVFQTLDNLGRSISQSSIAYSCLLIFVIGSFIELSNPGILYSFLPLYEGPRSGITWFIAILAGSTAYAALGLLRRKDS